jgi:hypothetical protein
MLVRPLRLCLAMGEKALREKNVEEKKTTDLYVMRPIKYIRDLLHCEDSSFPNPEAYHKKVWTTLVNDGKILLYLPKVFSILHCRQAEGNLDQEQACVVANVATTIVVHLDRSDKALEILKKGKVEAEGLVASLMGALHFARGSIANLILPNALGSVISLLEKDNNKKEFLRLITQPKLELLPTLLAICQEYVAQDENIFCKAVLLFAE